MQQETAETLALQALAHLVGDDDLLAAFLALSGAGMDEMRQRAAEPAFLGAVLDFILQEDARVLALAAATGVPPLAIAEARAALPGGRQIHWT